MSKENVYHDCKVCGKPKLSVNASKGAYRCFVCITKYKDAEGKLSSPHFAKYFGSAYKGYYQKVKTQKSESNFVPIPEADKSKPTGKYRGGFTPKELEPFGAFVYDGDVYFPYYKGKGYHYWDANSSIWSAHPDSQKKNYGIVGLESLKDKSFVVVVEGIRDMLMMRRYGIPAVSILGSKPSRHLISIIKKFDNVILALDNDKAGIACTKDFLKSIPYALDFQYKCNMVGDKLGKDPYDMRKRSIDELKLLCQYSDSKIRAFIGFTGIGKTEKYLNEIDQSKLTIIAVPTKRLIESLIDRMHARSYKNISKISTSKISQRVKERIAKCNKGVIVITHEGLFGLNETVLAQVDKLIIDEELMVSSVQVMRNAGGYMLSDEMTNYIKSLIDKGKIPKGGVIELDRSEHKEFYKCKTNTYVKDKISFGGKAITKPFMDYFIRLNKNNDKYKIFKFPNIARLHESVNKIEWYGATIMTSGPFIKAYDKIQMQTIESARKPGHLNIKYVYKSGNSSKRLHTNSALVPHKFAKYTKAKCHKYYKPKEWQFNPSIAIIPQIVSMLMDKYKSTKNTKHYKTVLFMNNRNKVEDGSSIIHLSESYNVAFAKDRDRSHLGKPDEKLLTIARKLGYDNNLFDFSLKRFNDSRIALSDTTHVAGINDYIKARVVLFMASLNLNPQQMQIFRKAYTDRWNPKFAIEGVSALQAAGRIRIRDGKDGTMVVWSHKDAVVLSQMMNACKVPNTVDSKPIMSGYSWSKQSNS